MRGLLVFLMAHSLPQAVLTAAPLLTRGLLTSGPGTRGPRLALSTFYRAHRGYGFLFVTADDHEVALLDGA